MWLVKADEAIMGWFERRTHSFQIWTGYNNFWLARHLLYLVMLGHVGPILGFFYRNVVSGGRTPSAAAASALLELSMAGYLSTLCTKEESRGSSDVLSQPRWLLFLDTLSIRASRLLGLILLVIPSPFVIGWARLGFGFRDMNFFPLMLWLGYAAWIVFFYVVQVHSLPWQKSRLHAYRDSLRAAFRGRAPVKAEK